MDATMNDTTHTITGPTTYDGLPRKVVEGQRTNEVDWDAVGMEVVTSNDDGTPIVVKKDNRELKGGMILRVTNTGRAMRFLGEEAILAALDGTSFKVSQQDVLRAYLLDVASRAATGAKVMPNVLLNRLWDRLAGIRRPIVRGPAKVVTVTVTVVKVMLPNGEVWAPEPGNDAPPAAQLRSAFMDVYMNDFAMPPEIAVARVSKMDFDAMLTPMQA